MESLAFMCSISIWFECGPGFSSSLAEEAVEGRALERLHRQVEQEDVGIGVHVRRVAERADVERIDALVGFAGVASSNAAKILSTAAWPMSVPQESSATYT